MPARKRYAKTLELPLLLLILALAAWETFDSFRDYRFVSGTFRFLTGMTDSEDGRNFPEFFTWGHTSDEKFLLRGEKEFFPHPDTFHTIQQDIQKKYPDDPAWQMNSVRHTGEPDLRILHTFSKAEPDNAKYDYYIATALLAPLVRWDAEKKLADPLQHGEIFQLFLSGSRKPYCRSYIGEVLKRKSQALGNGTDYPSAIARMLLPQTTWLTPSYTSLFINIPVYAESLAGQGGEENTQKAIELLDAFKPFIRQHVEDAVFTSEISLVNMLLRQNTENFVNLYRRLGRNDKADELRAWSYYVQAVIYKNYISPFYNGSEGMGAKLFGTFANDSERLENLRTEQVFDLRCWTGMTLVPILALLSLILFYTRYGTFTVTLALIFILGIQPGLLLIEKYRTASDRILTTQDGIPGQEREMTETYKQGILRILNLPPEKLPPPPPLPAESEMKEEEETPEKTAPSPSSSGKTPEKTADAESK